MSRHSAAKYAKIDHETLSNWVKRDATFSRECGRAETEFEREMIQAARDGVAKQPKLAVDMLERRVTTWNKDAQTAQVAGNQRNTIAPQLVIALCNVPERHVDFTQTAQVIDAQ
jgi:hypothetical protein